MRRPALDLQPTLTDDRVLLRPLQPGDFEALYAIASDPLIWEQHPNPLRYQRPVFETYFAGAIQSGGAFLVVEAATGSPMGSSRFYDHDPSARSVLIGYSFLGRRYWGGPSNRAVKTLMLDHAFRFVDHVFLHVGAENRRSQRAMEKLGAQRLGERTVAYHGEPETTNLVYRIRRPHGAGEGT
ncbi:MAG TPA: GNAT family N-acetyltransferase [Myxococcaceae bacterium]|nr:GNAT family N-acetyltransferase [Myxococcaceae bacterium]